MALEEGETCCICYDEMAADQNLTYCQHGCGKQIHVDCLERYVRFKKQNGLAANCPMCRAPLGQDIAKNLQKTQKAFRSSSINARSKAIFSADMTAKRFTCRGCLRLTAHNVLNGDLKYQSVTNPAIVICSSCFKGSAH